MSSAAGDISLDDALAAALEAANAAGALVSAAWSSREAGSVGAGAAVKTKSSSVDLVTETVRKVCLSSY